MNERLWKTFEASKIIKGSIEIDTFLEKAILFSIQHLAWNEFEIDENVHTLLYKRYLNCYKFAKALPLPLILFFIRLSVVVDGETKEKKSINRLKKTAKTENQINSIVSNVTDLFVGWTFSIDCVMYSRFWIYLQILFWVFQFTKMMLCINVIL